MNPPPSSSGIAYGAAFLFLCWLVWAVTGFVGGHVTGWFGAFNVLLSGAALAAVGWLAYHFKGKSPKPEEDSEEAGSV